MTFFRDYFDDISTRIGGDVDPVELERLSELFVQSGAADER